MCHNHWILLANVLPSIDKLIAKTKGCIYYVIYKRSSYYGILFVDNIYIRVHTHLILQQIVEQNWCMLGTTQRRMRWSTSPVCRAPTRPTDKLWIECLFQSYKIAQITSMIRNTQIVCKYILQREIYEKTIMTSVPQIYSIQWFSTENALYVVKFQQILILEKILKLFVS